MYREIPIPLSDLERIGFSVSARSQVFDSPLSKAWCGFDSVCRIAHPISKSKCCGDFMDAIQNSLQQKLSRLSQVDSFFSNSLHSSYEYPLFPHSVSPYSVFSSFICFKPPQNFRQCSTTFTLSLISLQFPSEVSDTQGFWCCFYPFFWRLKETKESEWFVLLLVWDGDGLCW